MVDYMDSDSGKEAVAAEADMDSAGFDKDCDKDFDIVEDKAFAAVAENFCNCILDSDKDWQKQV